MVPAFEQAAFGRKPKEIGDLVRTEYGLHILEVLEKQPAKVKPFEEVKAELATERKREAVFTKMQQSIEQARAELAKAPQSAAQIAAKYGLAYADVQNAGKGDPIQEVGVNPELEANLASFGRAKSPLFFRCRLSKLAVAAVTNVQPAKPAALAEVEGQIRELVTNRKLGQLTEQKVRETMDRIKSMQGSDLSAIAKAIGGEVRSTQLFSSEGAADGIGPASYLREAFEKPAGSMLAPFNLGNQIFVAKVTEKQVADAAALAATRDQVLLTLKQKKAQERKELFEDGLLTTLIKEGKVKKNQDTIKRLVTQYVG